MTSTTRKIISSHHPKKHYNSFRYAFSGIKYAFLQERNFRFHLLISVSIIILGFFYDLNYIEWAIVSFSIGLVLVCEMINTLLEDLMDFISPAYSDEVKIIKDISAGFVLVAAVIAMCNGLLIFIPKIFQSL
ncbi:diacylglycerol kinase family protein [Candidatus Curtissbacteria bacterium]|nr:diacylglycerol kinase family protein [Candidatus Curtissbacteria bacterium]